jgi:inner membrane protein
MSLFGLAAHWAWFVVAALLATAEILAPGFFLIWIGGAALLTGFAAMLGVPVGAQFAVFGVSAMALVVAGRRYGWTKDVVSDDPMLNDRGARLVGTVVTAVGPIDADSGRVQVGDSVWSARGVVAAAGDRLRVKSVEGVTLIVERA